MSAAEQQQQQEIKAGLEALPGFDVIGVSVVTDNQKGTDDINALWQNFFESQIGTVLEDTKIDDNIYAVYSDYQGDHEAPYRLTIGYKVQDTDSAPAGFHHVHVQTQDYASLAAQGVQPQSLIDTWNAIWSGDLPRSFKTDFEFYGPRFFEEGVHEAIVYVGLNDQSTAE